MFLFLQIGYKRICVYIYIYMKHPQVLRLRLNFYLNQKGDEITASLVRFYSCVNMGLGVVLFRCIHSPLHR